MISSSFCLTWIWMSHPVSRSRPSVQLLQINVLLKLAFMCWVFEFFETGLHQNQNQSGVKQKQPHLLMTNVPSVRGLQRYSLPLFNTHTDTHKHMHTSILICSKTALSGSNMAPSCSTSFCLILAQIAFARNDGVIFSSCTSHPVNTELGSGIKNVPRECFLESAKASPNLLLSPVELFLPISSFALHFSSSPLYACPSLPFCDSPSFSIAVHRRRQDRQITHPGKDLIISTQPV